MILNELAKYSKIIYSHNLASNYVTYLLLTIFRPLKPESNKNCYF